MQQNERPPPIYLASTYGLRNPKLVRQAEARLEEGRALLMDGGQTETVRLLDIVLLQLRMQLHGISQAELNALTVPRTGESASNRRVDAGN